MVVSGSTHYKTLSQGLVLTLRFTFDPELDKSVSLCYTRLKNSLGLLHHVFIHIGDLHLVLSALNLSTLDVDILMKMERKWNEK